MAWQKYTLAFRLLSPLHIGFRKAGNLMQTRRYVPGKNLWAALTARLTGTVGRGADGPAYGEIGQQVKDSFRFTYLYPALAEAGGHQTHHPWSDDQFDYRFLDSYASTALNYERQSAAEGLLHETEFIAPFARCGRPVYLTGDLYVRTELPEALCPWQEALAQLQFGGERGYGWGRTRLCGCDANGPPTDRVSIQLVAGEPLPAHLVANGQVSVRGPVEPLIGWERNPKADRPWRLSERAIIAYAPGSQVGEDATFAIGAYGHLTLEVDHA